MFVEWHLPLFNNLKHCSDGQPVNDKVLIHDSKMPHVNPMIAEKGQGGIENKKKWNCEECPTHFNHDFL